MTEIVEISAELEISAEDSSGSREILFRQCEECSLEIKQDSLPPLTTITEALEWQERDAHIGKNFPNWTELEQQQRHVQTSNWILNADTLDERLRRSGWYEQRRELVYRVIDPILPAISADPWKSGTDTQMQLIDIVLDLCANWGVVPPPTLERPVTRFFWVQRMEERSGRGQGAAGRKSNLKECLEALLTYTAISRISSELKMRVSCKGIATSFLTVRREEPQETKHRKKQKSNRITPATERTVQNRIGSAKEILNQIAILGEQNSPTEKAIPAIQKEFTEQFLSPSVMVAFKVGLQSIRDSICAAHNEKEAQKAIRR